MSATAILAGSAIRRTLTNVCTGVSARWQQAMDSQYRSLLSLDDLVVEEIKGFGLYLQRKFYQANLIIEMTYLALSFLFVQKSPDNLDRILFCAAILLDFCTVVWTLPNVGLSRVKVQGGMALIRQYLLNVYLHHDHTFQLALINSTLFFTSCFTFRNNLYKLLAATLAACTNSYFFVEYHCAVETTIGNRIFTYFFFYLTCIFISHGYHLVLSEYSKRFEHTRHQAQAELRSKGMFVTSVTHDLKNPISSIQGSIDMLKTSRGLSEEDKKELTTASYSCQILLYLIGNITDITKMEAGKFDIDRVPMSISEELGKIVQIESEISKRKNLSLHKRVLTPLPTSVYGDPMRFSQVLINLIGNAIKFTSHGYVGLVFRWANNVNEAKNFEYLDPEAEEPSIIPPDDFFVGRSSSNKVPTRKSKPSHTSLEMLRVERPIHKLTADPSPMHKYDVGGEEFEDSVRKRMEKYDISTQKREFRLGSQTEMRRLETKPCCCGSPKRRISSGDNHPRRGTTTGWLRAKDQPACDDSSELVEVQRSPRHAGSCTLFEQVGEELAQGEEFEDGLLVIDVIDTGVGMSKEEMMKLFQPFSQANRDIRRQFGGTGLGLWITKQLLTLMNGLIQVDSEQKRGTRFRVTIPFKVAAEKDGTSSSSAGDSVADVLKIIVRERSWDLS